METIRDDLSKEEVEEYKQLLEELLNSNFVKEHGEQMMTRKYRRKMVKLIKKAKTQYFLLENYEMFKKLGILQKIHF